MIAVAKKERSDAERRVRQCERLGRLLRLLHLISGRGRWDANTLAEELDCSRRTVYRLLQTLSMAGVPWYFDEADRAYRIRPGFRFPLFETAGKRSSRSAVRAEDLEPVVERLIREGESFVGTLRQFLEALRDC